MAISSSLPPASSPVVFVDRESGIAEPFLCPHEQETDWKSQEDSSFSLKSGGATFVRTCFNGLNALSGVGILSIPYALASGGWLSLVFLFLIAAICCYTGILLQRCMNKNPRVMKTYPDIGDFAFGRRGRVATSVVLYMELYLVAIGFLILEGDNLNKLFPGAGLSFGTLTIAGKQLFVLLAALVILPTTWLRSMGLLAFISAGGVLASVVVACAVLSSAVLDVGFRERGRLVSSSGMPTALGLYAFCYCGHAVFPTLCTSMKDKTKFSKVLLICFALCTVNYAAMAIFGYLMYGDDIKSQVTLNLPVGKISSQIAIYTTLINPLSKFALMTAPIASAIEENLASHSKRIYPYFVRTLIVLSTVIIAIAVPFFGYLMAFIGSLLSVTVSILLPCICYVKIFRLHGIHVVELVFIFCILVMGLFIAITGTYSSLREIYHSL